MGKFERLKHESFTKGCPPFHSCTVGAEVHNNASGWPGHSQQQEGTNVKSDY